VLAQIVALRAALGTSGVDELRRMARELMALVEPKRPSGRSPG
jgi:hypothetical protein